MLQRCDIEQKNVSIAVMGLGYVGLPLAVEFARAGFCVWGLDTSHAKVEALLNKNNYIPDVNSDDLYRLIDQKKLCPSTDMTVLQDVQAVILCVPTPLNKTWEPDMSFILSATEAVAKHLHPGMLISLESTTYPGTTEEVIAPILEDSGYTLDEDVFLSFSPERVDPGNPRFKTHNIPKIVGGIGPKSLELACALYGSIVEQVVPVSAPRVAETAKLLENTFRTVNIGLINEMALMCQKMNIDVWEVIDAASTKPFGFMPFYPGPGLGGHCLPVDPLYLAWKAKFHNFETRFIHLAAEVNRSMPHFVVDRVADILNDRSKPIKGSSVLVLGVAYKADVDDLRESPALDVMELLVQKGAHVTYADPHVEEVMIFDQTMHACELSDEVLAASDCVVIVTAHKAFDFDKVVQHAPVVLDMRNATKHITENRHKIVKF